MANGLLAKAWDRVIARLARLETRPATGSAVVTDPQPPLSILHVDLTSDYGGSEVYCIDLMTRQLARGHRVTLVARHPKPGQADAVQNHVPPGVTVYLARRNFARFSIARAIREQSVDVINTHLYDSVRATKLVRPRPPALLTMHLRHHADQTHGLDGLICIADWQLQETAAFRGPKVVAYNWPPPEQPVDPERVAALRQALGAAPNTTIVGYLGRLAPVKNVDYLIRAFRAVATPNSILAIAGNGALREKLETLAEGEPRIRFLGHRADVTHWHRAFDLFVLPSKWEGLSLSLLEAMRAGAPILATTSDGTEEVLRHTPATLIPPSDQAAMTAALGALLARAAAGDLPRVAYDMRRFDVNAAVEKIEAFYRQVIAAGKVS